MFIQAKTALPAIFLMASPAFAAPTSEDVVAIKNRAFNLNSGSDNWLEAYQRDLQSRNVDDLEPRTYVTNKAGLGWYALKQILIQSGKIKGKRDLDEDVFYDLAKRTYITNKAGIAWYALKQILIQSGKIKAKRDDEEDLINLLSSFKARAVAQDADLLGLV